MTQASLLSLYSYQLVHERFIQSSPLYNLKTNRTQFSLTVHSCSCGKQNVSSSINKLRTENGDCFKRHSKVEVLARFLCALAIRPFVAKRKLQGTYFWITRIYVLSEDKSKDFVPELCRRSWPRNAKGIRTENDIGWLRVVQEIDSSGDYVSKNLVLLLDIHLVSPQNKTIIMWISHLLSILLGERNACSKYFPPQMLTKCRQGVWLDGTP